MTTTPRILLTGATGYVGGRLLDALQRMGEDVRCVTRRPTAVPIRGSARTEVIEGDLRVDACLDRALANVDVAYYLVHSMNEPDGFEEDRVAATRFAAAARRAGVRRIIYLGGLGSGENLSPHLASRQDVGRILRESGVPTVELRSSIIIGAGSLSFDLVSSLVTRLPVMVTPRWVRTLTQPIAIDDVIEYLLAARDLPAGTNRVYEIGGPDQVSYGDLMREYAHQRGLRRLILPVPMLSPGLSSLWLGLVTPLYARIGRHLVEGVRNETIVTDDAARRELPIEPRGVRVAIADAIADVDHSPRRWQDALPTRASTLPQRPLGKQLVDSRWVRVQVSPEAAFAPIQRIGGATGWYYGDWLWRIRGAIDLLVGGVGMRRGRRHPVQLEVGDMLDFWRVEAIDAPHLLRLSAEMRLPGRAWLQYRVEADGNGSVIRQSAFFDPAGIPGRLYWYGLAPAHRLIFPRMLDGIVAAIDTRQP